MLVQFQVNSGILNNIIRVFNNLTVLKSTLDALVGCVGVKMVNFWHLALKIYTYVYGIWIGI
jgi:hypothetical protein